MGTMTSSYLKSEKFYGWHEYGIYLGESPVKGKTACTNSENCKKVFNDDSDFCSCNTDTTNKDFVPDISLNTANKEEKESKEEINLEHIESFGSFTSTNLNSNLKNESYTSLNETNTSSDKFNSIPAIQTKDVINKYSNINLIKFDNIINEQSQEATNIKKDGRKLRNQYINKLMVKDLLVVKEASKVYNESIYENEEIQRLNIYNHKFHNSIIIFDWDDTLMFTSYLEANDLIEECSQMSLNKSKLTQETLKRIKELDEYCFYLLSKALDHGDTYIITNAELSWVQLSARKYYPKTYLLLNKIKVISARELYEKNYKEDMFQWKLNSFNNEVYNKYANERLTNIVCIGDSKHEQEAAKSLAKKFKNVYTKIIKFRSAPTLEELAKQLQLTLAQFTKVIGEVKNLNITVERKS